MLSVVIARVALSLNLLIRQITLTVLVLTMAACTSAPVQEMSDARQAIYSAEAAGAMQRSHDTLQRAQHLLQEAQTRLEAGAYEAARQSALDARSTAIKAREQAISTRSSPP